MINYIEAFNQGLEASNRAENDNLEISTILDELNKQLEHATQGRVKIKIGLQKVNADEPSCPVNQLSGFITQKEITIDKPFKEERNKSIIAYNPLAKNSKKMEIAKWSKDSTGYPCKITLGYREHYCEDKEALENMLADMLKDPSTGKILQKLMQSSENQAA